MSFENNDEDRPLDFTSRKTVAARFKVCEKTVERLEKKDPAFPRSFLVGKQRRYITRQIDAYARSKVPA
jgi:hypothetical protein